MVLDQQLGLISEAQLAPEECLQACPQNNEAARQVGKPIAATKQSLRYADAETASINRFGCLLCYALVSRDAKCADETTMQCRDAIKSAGALVVLSSHRWAKMLVRRQAHAFEIIVELAPAGIRKTGYQRPRFQRPHRGAEQSIGFTSLGTD